MTKKEQLLIAITMLDESDCEYVLKILSEETRKDFEKVFCEHCGLPIRLPGNGTVTQLCECRLHE